mgnify:CR=1 FL=1
MEGAWKCGWLDRMVAEVAPCGLVGTLVQYINRSAWG